VARPGGRGQPLRDRRRRRNRMRDCRRANQKRVNNWTAKKIKVILKKKKKKKRILHKIQKRNPELLLHSILKFSVENQTPFQL
jgi:hypothetical protein